MKFLSTLLTAIFLFSALPLHVSAVTQCDAGIERKIDELVEGEGGWLETLSGALTAREYKLESLNQSIKDLRNFQKDLQHICDTLEYAYNYANEIGTEDFVPHEAYDINDLEGEDAICIFDPRDAYTVRDAVLESCQEKINITGVQAQTFLQIKYGQASRQDEGNYYSAKLLSLTVRLKGLGDMLHELQRRIRSTFESIACRCSS